ncbi:DMT family transporter [Herbiconiux sp. L3-i23]|uniref:EamA family transporter n=1 Tax=Herbiconiux sp. L3-i23 TaxID=2905871 RepID=UPI0020493860|nr:EamA family transporter [Herbiconiux sp. L3-i23]BDI22741.1 threonine transporter RhtB [Herbiconiux sp. L3-i23]
MAPLPSRSSRTLFAAGPIVSAASVQTGAGFGASLLPLIGPIGVVGLRQFFAALVLLPVVIRGARGFTWKTVRPALLLGLMLVVMNLGIYGALERIPLGLAVTLEFLGPLALALLSSRRLVDLFCGLAAGGGVVLLTGTVDDLDLLGVLLALLAGAAWVGYIVFGQGASHSLPGAQGTAVASGVASLITLPMLVVILVHTPAEELGRIALIGLVVGVLSSALPYSIDLAVLKRVPRGLFSVLQSVHPAAAAVSGLLILGQSLGLGQVVGLVVISLANVVAVAQSSRRSAAARRAEEALTV